MVRRAISKGVDYMLGKYVRVRVTNPIHSVNRQFGFTYQLNFGMVEGKKRYDNVSCGAYIMGINHPVRTFDGRVIAVIRHSDSTPPVYVVAPKSTRFIIHQIQDAIAFAHGDREYKIECLHEKSCGAVVYSFINDEIRYLIIKNRRSAHWSFPKGHVERGETDEETAIREVFEETGVHIKILPGFAVKNNYTIQNRVEKTVMIFIGKADSPQTTIQKEEIEDYSWLNYEKALGRFRFANDKNILRSAHEYLIKKGIIER